MPTPTEITESIIDPLMEDVEELTHAIEGDLVHIAGAETITGLKTFTQVITAPGFYGPLHGDIAAGVKLLGPLDMNGFGFLNVAGTGFEQLANKGVANGYAPLGAGGLVPAVNLGTGGGGAGDNFLADDGQFRPISAGSVSFGTQAANLVFAGPGTGSAASPAFRILVAADIPALAESKITGLVSDLAGKVATSRLITAGVGLTGGGDLSADRTLTLGTPTDLDIDSPNSVSGTTHSHAILSSANPGAAAALLASDGSGYLTLVRLTLTDRLLINALVSNLYLKDTSSGFQVATTQVITPQAGNVFRNTTFTSGIVGWNIDDDGNAEFNNLNVRGEIRSSVFKVNEIAATAGTLGVFYSAANLYADVTTPGSTSSSFTFDAKNSDAGGMLFAVGDVVRFKTWTGSGISDSWATITARTNHTTYSTYTATLNSGSTSATFRAGTAVVDYGPSGTGFITLSADGTVGSSPNLTMATHAGSPWSAQTTLLRAGNLNGSYGYATNVYGFGIGQYGVASKSWLTIDQTNGIRIGNNTAIVGQWNTTGDIFLGDPTSFYIKITNALKFEMFNGADMTFQVSKTGAIYAEDEFSLSDGATTGVKIQRSGVANFLTSLVVGSATAAATHMLDVYGTGWFSGAVTFAAGMTIDAWTAPTLLNSWVNFGGTYDVAGYRKEPDGNTVRLKGLLKNGTTTSGTVLFNLPVGYRPASDKIFAVSTGGVFAILGVHTNGDVLLEQAPANNASFSISGVTFSTT